MATATKTKPSRNGKPKGDKPRKPRQQYIEGLEPPSNPKLDRLAERFEDARDAWQALHQPMMDAQDLLHTAMKEAGVNYHKTPSGLQCFVVVGPEKVKVKRKKAEADDAF